MDGVYDVDQLERDCADAWPAVVDEPLGQWRLRAAGGFTGRANSALTIGDPGVPMDTAFARVMEFAHGNGIAPTAHVVRGAPIEDNLARAGWAVNEQHSGGAESVVMTGELFGFAGPVPENVGVYSRPPAGWWPLAVDASRPTPAQERVLAGRRGLGFGSAVVHGAVVGIVRGAVVGELLHIARLAVAPDHRLRGVATGLLTALASWAWQHGASRAVLQVATHNKRAISLYAGLGCRPHHRYRYWVPGR
jgi:ribosomal protein S18 acetylase RimI-like enzyme